MKNSQKIILKSLEDTKKVAKEIANELETYIKTKSLIIFLKGELGSGKTTLTKEILKRLGIHEPVTSPTFTIIEPYSIKNKKIYHMDLYRIENRKELEVLGIEEYLNENESMIFVEWPEKGGDFFNYCDLELKLNHVDENSRELIYKNFKLLNVENNILVCFNRCSLESSLNSSEPKYRKV